MSTPALVFTDNAVLKVKSLMEEEGNPDLKLRIFITGGGCSGFQYGFTFEESVNDDDTVIEKDVDDEGGDGGEAVIRISKVQLLIDPMSFTYLAGAEIDYKKDIHGEQFVIRNPNAETTCGCGSSFSV